MGTINCIIVGNLSRDPELITANSGTTIAKFAIPVHRRYKKDDEWKTETEWCNCVAFAKTAENIIKYFNKGKPIYLEVRPSTLKWEDDNGVKHSKTEYIVNKWEFINAQTEEQDAKQEQTSPTTPKTDDCPF